MVPGTETSVCPCCCVVVVVSCCVVVVVSCCSAACKPVSRFAMSLFMTASSMTTSLSAAADPPSEVRSRGDGTTIGANRAYEIESDMRKAERLMASNVFLQFHIYCFRVFKNRTEILLILTCRHCSLKLYQHRILKIVT